RSSRHKYCSLVSLSLAKYINGATIVNVTSRTVVQFFTLVGCVGRAMRGWNESFLKHGECAETSLKSGETGTNPESGSCAGIAGKTSLYPALAVTIVIWKPEPYGQWSAESSSGF